MAITLARKVGFGQFFFLILGIFDLLKPLVQVLQTFEVIFRGFGAVKVLGATRA